jgi:D-tyrosyl-tRNA(Tyr) deacylase
VIGLIQRVNQARIEVQNQTISSIDRGILALIGIENTDREANADRLLQRILAYRIFADPDGKMNLSLTDVSGDLLLIPQFTLTADTRKGLRPSFSPAAPPEEGERLFDYLSTQAKQTYEKVQCGKFGADMQVTLTNDGPVTFWLQT